MLQIQIDDVVQIQIYDGVQKQWLELQKCKTPQEAKDIILIAHKTGYGLYKIVKIL